MDNNTVDLHELTDDELVDLMNTSPDEVSGAAQQELEKRGYSFGDDE